MDAAGAVVSADVAGLAVALSRGRTVWAGAAAWLEMVSPCTGDAPDAVAL